MIWKVGAGLSSVLVLFGVALGVVRVGWLEDHEVREGRVVSLPELAEDDSATEESVRLMAVHLYSEQMVVFELCSDDRMEPERWADAVAVAVWRPRAHEVMTRSEMTPEVLSMVRRDETHGCLTIGRGRLADEDDYAIELFWEGERPPALDAASLTVRVQGKREIETIDRTVVILTWLGSFGLVLSLLLRRRAAAAALAPPAAPEGGLDPGAAAELAGPDAVIAPAPVSERGTVAELDAANDPDGSAAEVDPWEEAQAASRRPIPSWARLIGGLALVVGSFQLSAFAPAGAAVGLALGVALAGFEVAVAIGAAPGGAWSARLGTLGLHRPKRWYLWIPLALLVGVSLVQVARLSTLIVPSTGQSPIQTFVSWPSGLLSFATLAVVAPFAEEVFFRGFVYGVIEPRSKVAAFLGGWLLFVLAHAPQTWGQWGALTAILVTGLGLTSLRALSGSTLVAAVAHLTYNGLLALGAILP